jgi:Na+-translocating ferredoxin:NAD+ oxidoreductase subunit C
VLRGYTFKRGIHPKDKKDLSKNKTIERLPYPEELVVSLSQHIGAPAKAVVNAGDRVEMGQLIGEPSSFVSAAVHSPVRGSVKEIRKTTLASGAVVDAVVIVPESEQPELFTERFDWKNQSREELSSLVRESGIVGMGGATFPTSVKFAVGERKVEYLVINAVECEPYLTCDYRLMLERPEGIIEGAQVAAKILNPDNVIIAVEENKEDAALVLENKAKEMGFNVTVALMKMKYPQGDEKQLLYALTKRQVPSGKLPLDIGCIVCSTSSIYALYEAAVFHKPVFERVVTVTGEAIAEPKNLIVPVGTSFRKLFEYCHGDETKCDEFIAGGPMMGFSFPSLDTPTVKGNNGLLCIKKFEEKSFPCMHCGKCAQHCPMGLTPNNMYRLITHGMYREAMDIGLMDCKECGCCAYSCPSQLRLVQTFRLGKKMGRNAK